MPDQNTCIENLGDKDLCSAVSDAFDKCMEVGDEVEVCRVKSNMLGRIAKSVANIFQNHAQSIYNGSHNAGSVVNLIDSDNCAERYATINLNGTESDEFCRELSQNINRCALSLSDNIIEYDEQNVEDTEYFGWCKTTGRFIADYSISLYNGIKSQVLSVAQSITAKQAITDIDSDAKSHSILKYALVGLGVCAFVGGAAAAILKLKSSHKQLSANAAHNESAEQNLCTVVLPADKELIHVNDLHNFKVPAASAKPLQNTSQNGIKTVLNKGCDLSISQ